MSDISVTTVAAYVLDPSDVSHGAGLGTNCQTFIKNIGVNTVYLGPTDSVSDSDGFPLDAGESMEMEIGTGRAVYGVTASGSSILRVLRV